ncbi:MAG: hypothetical protein QM796_06805 [Chthoniobacteraceae bacterium]
MNTPLVISLSANLLLVAAVCALLAWIPDSRMVSIIPGRVAGNGTQSFETANGSAAALPGAIKAVGTVSNNVETAGIAPVELASAMPVSQPVAGSSVQALAASGQGGSGNLAYNTAPTSAAGGNQSPNASGAGNGNSFGGNSGGSNGLGGSNFSGSGTAYSGVASSGAASGTVAASPDGSGEASSSVSDGDGRFSLPVQRALALGGQSTLNTLYALSQTNHVSLPDAAKIWLAGND